MKKIISLSLIGVFFCLCGCTAKENSDSKLLLDTVVTLTAVCDNETLEGAFSLCSDYEKLLSKTLTESDVYKLNSNGTSSVSKHTEKIIERSLYYSEKTNGKFDITMCSVSDLWDFKNEIVPEKNEIAKALKNVDYEAIEIGENRVFLNGTKIDLGGIAKGYIADRLIEYFKENNVHSGIVNLGGNVAVFGKEYTIGIQHPLDSEKIAAKIKLSNQSAVTSGIYQRSFEKQGKLYHHILDKKTGYPVENSLASVTVIGKSSFDCDALSTCCLTLGLKDGLDLINQTEETEAVFIDKNGEITLSEGLYIEKNEIFFK